MKKSQTEDIFSDLLPSIVFIVIGIFLLNLVIIPKEEAVVHINYDLDLVTFLKMPLDFSNSKISALVKDSRLDSRSNIAGLLALAVDTDEFDNYIDSQLSEFIRYEQSEKGEISKRVAYNLDIDYGSSIKSIGPRLNADAFSAETIIPGKDEGIIRVRLRIFKSLVTR
jgi:hypothetical protein